ncbi:MAG: hypothetical protein E7623_02690 [Ruminococcaceae bacterium]|nr:hypothetical protein [Oscillospiraceae bacterium]
MGMGSAKKTVIFVAAFFLIIILPLLVIDAISELKAKEDIDGSEDNAENIPLYCNVDIRTKEREWEYELPSGINAEEALKMCGIEFDANDILSCGRDHLINEDTEIRLTYVDAEAFTYTETVAFDTVYLEVQDIPKGTAELVCEGETGTDIIYSEIEYHDGIVYTENFIKRETVKKPVDRVVRIGVGGSFIGNDGQVHDYSYYIDMVATAYYGSGYTKSGKWVRPGMIAVDPRVLDLGTKVYLTGEFKDYGVVSCEDTGGFIKGKRIDIYMLTLEECCEFGRRNMRVYILEDQEKYSYVTE